MAHLILVRDTVTGACGLAQPLCPTEVVAGDASVTVNNTGTALAPAYTIYANETTTTLGWDPSTSVLTYTNEDGVASTIDLSQAVDVNVAGPLTGTGTAADPIDIDFCSMSAADMTCLVSADAGQDIMLGTDGKLYAAHETTTSLNYNAGTTVLSYTDEDGGVTNIDLSALTADIYVNGGSFDPSSMVLTLTDNDGGTSDITVDLSSLQSSITNNLDGTYTHDSGNGTTTIINVVSASAGNDIIVGFDGGAYLDVQASETTTSIVDNDDGTITFNDEDGGATTIDVAKLICEASFPNLGPLECE